LQSLEKRNKGREVRVRKQKKEARKIIERFILCFFNAFASADIQGVPEGNVPDFGRLFLKLKYTVITKNNYIRS